MKPQTPDARHDEFLEMLPWYVNGTLTEADRRSVQEHMDNCVECHESVDLLMLVQNTMRNDSPSPLVPEPRADGLLDLLDSADRPPQSKVRLLGYAAAAIAAAIGLALMLTEPLSTVRDEPTVFQTATSPDAGEIIHYVIELRFSPGIESDARNASLAELGAGSTATPMPDGSFRVTLGLKSISLKGLERRMGEIEERPEIDSARVVAVQFPVD